MSEYLPPPPPVSPFRTSFSFNDATSPTETSSSSSFAEPPSTAPATMTSHSSSLPPLSASTLYGSTPDTASSMSFPRRMNVKNWDTLRVREWLETIRCSQYFRLFEENHITGDVLLECDLQALKDLGVRKVGDRIRIHQAVKNLRIKSLAGCNSDTKDQIQRQKSLQELDMESISPFVAAGPGLPGSLSSAGGASLHSSSPVDSYFVSRPNKGRPTTATTANNNVYASVNNRSISAPNSASTMTKTQTAVFKDAATSKVKNILSMDVVKQDTVRFVYSQGQSKTVNISGCNSVDEIKSRALKKLGLKEIHPEDWAVHVADNELGTTTRQLNDSELSTICRTVDRSERKRLMICAVGTTPTLKQLSKSQQILREAIASGVGPSDTRPHSKIEEGDVADYDDETRSVFPEVAPNSGHLNRLSGQRPPSELISSNLSHFFPEVGTNELQKTVRNSIRFSKRLSRMSRVSARMSRISNRASIASSLAWGIPEDEEEVPPMPSLDEVYDSSTLTALTSPLAFQHLPGGNNTDTLTSNNNNGTIGHDNSGTIGPASNDNTGTIGSATDNSGNERQERRKSQGLIPANLLSRVKNAASLRRQSMPPADTKKDQVEVKRASVARSVEVEYSSKTGEEEEEEEEEPTEAMPKEEEPVSSETESTNDDESDVSNDIDALTSEDDFIQAIEQEESAPTKWIKGRLIGSGSFGTVYLGMNSFTGALMAVKQVELPADDNENAQRKKGMVDALQREMDILRELHHENIVQYLGSNSEGNHLNIFLEYVPGGSVATLLANYGEFSEPLIRNFVRQILQGLKYLHGQNIIHRDIKGANVLVDNKGCIKISDFGISKKIEAKLLSTNRVSLQGSVYWMAPEVVKQTSYTIKADIWSLGCLIIEMFSGTHPFPEFSQMQAIFKLGNSTTPTIPSNCTDEAKDFMSQTFAIDYTKRPTADELLNHSFIKKMMV
ncbi:serine/threonine-protein kinase Ste11p [Trichomonascus vanleenenianus]|uniref:STE11 family mitogen-activated protein kinase kinase kinase n=1 Tax=Trichomonascus vanleenenianus TaxID=2268995 RepID=UPI003ECBA700